MSLLNEAILLAVQAHGGQVRKYNSLPYIVHPLEVMSILKSYTINEVLLSAAVCHDVLEDCHKIYDELLYKISTKVHDLVLQLTNPSKGSKLSRFLRKEMDRKHLANTHNDIKQIKLIDRICNLRDMSEAPTDFKRLYINESWLLLDECLRNVNHDLETKYKFTIFQLESSIK